MLELPTFTEDAGSRYFYALLLTTGVNFPHCDNKVQPSASHSANMACRDSKSMPIASVGFGCRFPGDVTNGEKLWDMLVQKKSARGEVPQDRFNVDAFYNPDGDRYGTVSLLQSSINSSSLTNVLV